MDPNVIYWFLIVGVLFVAMATLSSLFKRLPISTAMIYLVVGAAIGPYGLGLLVLDPSGEDSKLIEHLAEVAVVVSLFTAGLKLRMPLRDRRWLAPVMLATVSMVLTVAMVAVAGRYGMGLAWGAAILLGAVLAPTDPVLASDVSVSDPDDTDRLKLTLTGEAGLNDGTAFPFVMLGVGLLALKNPDIEQSLGAYGWWWLAKDVVWAVAAGLGIGWVAGRGVARATLYLRRERREAVGTDDFLALGVIALAYGLAVLVSAYGFLAVFAAGVALRQVERESNDGSTAGEAERNARREAIEAEKRELDEQEAAGRDGSGGGATAEAHEAHAADELAATDPKLAPTVLAGNVLEVNEQLERVSEVLLVVLLGALISPATFEWAMVWFVPLLLLVVRPVAVLPVLRGYCATPLQRRLSAWFGIRGIGSVYYLMFAVNQGLEKSTSDFLVHLTLATITASVVVHGVSVTPLMNWYSKTDEAKATGPDDRAGATAADRPHAEQAAG